MFGARNPYKMGKMDTVVGPGADLKGVLHVKGTLFIDGRVEGNVSTDDGIVMGEHGAVKGNLVAKNIVVGGKVQGNLIASSHVELLATAEVYGDLRAPRVIVDEGALFEGNCEMDRSELGLEQKAGKK